MKQPSYDAYELSNFLKLLRLQLEWWSSFKFWALRLNMEYGGLYHTPVQAICKESVCHFLKLIWHNYCSIKHSSPAPSSFSGHCLPAQSPFGHFRRLWASTIWPPSMKRQDKGSKWGYCVKGGTPVVNQAPFDHITSDFWRWDSRILLFNESFTN